MTTIREVAKASGVSVATVSRVLNGYADVGDATRQRVLLHARRLDYTPNAAARTLVTRRSHLIGVVLFTGDRHPDIQHPFFQDVLVGLKHGVGSVGYDLLLFASDVADRPQSYLRRVRQHRLDGVVLWGVDRASPALAELLASQTPVIAVDIDVTGERATWVASDNLGGARLAVRHLHALGHARIATIAGLEVTKPGLDRLLGFRAELDALGLPRRAEYERFGDFYAESGEKAMRELLELDEPPTAVFAAADMMAVGAIRAARSGGLRVPEDVAVVGFDDAAVASFLHPSLTTIRQDRTGLGLAAARALVREIEEPDAAPPPALMLPVELVVRESCGGAPSTA
jgi:LacI family transcriptional regulator